MAKSMYLFKLLPLAAVLVCGSAGGTDVGATDKRVHLQQVYLGAVGVREASGRNDGKQVEAYLRYTGLKRGDAWCAAFVCWCLGKADMANPRSGWSPDLLPVAKLIWKRSRGVKQLAGKEVFVSGNVFGIWFEEKGRIAHVGFTDGRQGNWLITVEGNTNEKGSREGDGVYRKRRLVSTVYAVADWVGGEY